MHGSINIKLYVVLGYYFKRWNNKKRIKIEYKQECDVEIFGFARDVACCLKHLVLLIRSTLTL